MANFQFNLVDSIGIIAGVLTTIAFIPQLVKTWQTRSAKDVSYGMFLLFSLGVILWGVYGWEIHSIPVLVANIVTLLLTISILTLKLVFSTSSKQESP